VETLDPRLFGPKVCQHCSIGIEVSGHFGLGTNMSYEQFNIGVEMSRLYSYRDMLKLVPKCLLDISPPVRTGSYIGQHAPK